MKAKSLTLMVFIAAVFFLIGRTSATTPPALHPQTLENLSTAMHGEAFAYAKYLLFARHARYTGNHELSDSFRKTAQVERFQHFAEEADLANIVGSNEDNLKDAIKGESYEIDTMYLQFAKQATEAGDNKAASRFEEIRQDEMGHRDSFKAALSKLEAKPPAKP